MEKSYVQIQYIDKINVPFCILQQLLRLTATNLNANMTSAYKILPHPPTSFSNPYIASPTSQLILQSFCCFTYVTAHSTDLALLHLRHSSFSNTCAASPTPQLILQPFHRFTYVTGNSTTLPLLHLRHRHFTYFTWRAAHA